MFITLLLVTFLVSVGVALLVARLFTPSLDRILRRIIADEISTGWLQYLRFAIVVVGVGTGVRIHELERYISPSEHDKEQRILELTSERWVLEIYRTIFETLEGIAWLLLWFFIVAMIAYVIVRVFELRKSRAGDDKASGG